MSTGMKWTSLLLTGLLCVSSMAGATTRNQRKPKKPALPPPLPSGPQGPVPQIPLDSIPAVAPQVIYESGQLTILAPNSTLGDILRAVRKQTAADIDIPANANERVVTSLGPGPAREVVAELLNGSRFNYVLLGSPSEPARLTRVVLVAKTTPEAVNEAAQPQNQPAMNGPAANLAPPPEDNPAEAQEADATDDATAEDNTDQNAADAEQQAVPAEQQPPGVKTPQQMLQEMQQRQLQMQQQLAPGQPPVPGAALPPPQPHPQPQQQEP